MTVFDVRNGSEGIKEIVFSESRVKDTTVACSIKPNKNYAGEIVITDSDYDYIHNIGYLVLVSKEDAENLIKALNKAIELEWVV